jgi:murein DD-endopeptidase MepM/ murein hydrolase activator NlpD
MHDDPHLSAPTCHCSWHGPPAADEPTGLVIGAGGADVAEVDVAEVDVAEATGPARVWSRRAVLQGALVGAGLGATGLAGLLGLTGRSRAGARAVAPTAAGGAPEGLAAGLAPIDAAATVAAPAERLLPTTTVPAGGSCPSPQPAPTTTAAGAPPRRVMFPMGPTPRCAILDNFGDPRGSGRRHEGIDILATLGQDVYAVADGELVDQADATASLSGNAWGLEAFEDGTYYFFAHLSGFAPGLRTGDCVRKGQLIGYVGDTGNPGPGNYHLHFEVRPNGKRGAAIDPLPLLEVPASCTIT